VKNYWLLVALAAVASFAGAQTTNSTDSGLPRDRNKTETKLHDPKVDAGSPKAHHVVTLPAKTATSSSQDELLRAERSSSRTAINHSAEKLPKPAPLKEPATPHRSGMNFNYQPPKQNNVQPNRISNRPQQQMTTPHR